MTLGKSVWRGGMSGKARSDADGRKKVVGGEDGRSIGYGSGGGNCTEAKRG